MATLVAAGYSGAELQDIVLNKEKMDFTKFEDQTFFGRFGAGGNIVSSSKPAG